MKLRLIIKDEYGGEVDSEQTWPGMRVGDVLVEVANLLGAIDDEYKRLLKARQKAAADAEAERRER